MKTTCLLPIPLALLAALATAQEPPHPEPPHPERQRLQKALQTMASLPSVAFATEERRDLAALRNQAAFGGGWVANLGHGASADEVSGVWADGLLYGRTADDEWILAGGRSIARSKADPTWRLRHRRLADGRRPPRLVDPQALVLLLLDSDLEVTGAEVGSRDDRPVELITARSSGDAVAELMWAGLLPTNGSSPAFVRGGAGAPVPPKPDAELDLCFVIDPATRVVHEIRTASYADSGAGGGAVFVAPAAPVRGRVVALEDVTEEEAEEPQQEEAAEEPVAEEPAAPQRAAGQIVVRLAGPGAPAAARPAADEEDAGRLPEGLPVRDKDGKDVVTFVIRFTEPGQAALPEVDARARRLLGR